MTDHVLFMCTANQCRSPMAETLARAAFADLTPPLTVSSAGELDGGQPATENAERAMAARGLDLAGHTSTQLGAELVARSALILTMERRHLSSIAAIDLEAVTRAFPLREFVRTAPPLDRGESIRSWAGRTHGLRDPIRILSVDTNDDIDDPIGGSFRKYRRCADMLFELIYSMRSLLTVDSGSEAPFDLGGSA